MAEGHSAEGEKIRLRDYQVEVVNKFIETQALQEVATGAGKTIMTATLSKLVEKYGRSIVIAQQGFGTTDRRGLH